MKNKKLEYIGIGVLIGAAFAIVMALIILTVTPAKRTTKATEYDLECMTTLKQNPLEECKK